MDKYTPMPSVRTIGPKLPFSAKEVRYVLSSDGSYVLIAFTEGGVFQLNESINRWEPRSRSHYRCGLWQRAMSGNHRRNTSRPLHSGV